MSEDEGDEERATDEPSPAAAFRRSTTPTSDGLPYHGVETFLRADLVAVEDAPDHDAAVLGVPYDGAVTNRPGARYGPRALRRRSAYWAYMIGEKWNVRTGEVVDYAALDLVDCGDVPVSPMDHATTRESVAAHVATVADGAMPVVLGGDHSVTYPAFRGFGAGAGHDRVGFVQVDTHSDVFETSTFDDHFHGATTRHVAESEYGDWSAVAQVGIRGYEPPGYPEFVDEVGLSLFTLPEVRDRGPREAAAAAVEAAADGTDAVYVTIDIDALDPSVAPGTGTPEPGGMTADEALAVVETLGAHEAVGAVDLVEVAPPYDPTTATSRTGATLLTTLLERRFL